MHRQGLHFKSVSIFIIFVLKEKCSLEKKSSLESVSNFLLFVPKEKCSLNNVSAPPADFKKFISP